MRTRHLYGLLVVGVVVSLLLSACQTPVASGSQIGAGFSPLKVEAANCDYGGKIQSIEAIDELTVKFTLCDPDPAFLAKIASPVFSIQDTSVLNDTQGDSALLSENVVGTGPYTVKQYLQADRITLEKNPDYWGFPAKNQEITFRWSVNPVIRQADLQFASADAVNNVNIPSYLPIIQDPRFKIYYRPALNIAYLGMNNTIAPFDDERVRQAFAIAIDRKSLVEDAFPVGSTQAEQFVPSTMKPGHSDVLLWWDYNPKDARDLLLDANFDFKTTIDLYYPNISLPFMSSPETVAEEIKDQLAAVGVKVKLVRSLDFLSLIEQGKVGLFLYGAIAEYPDPTAFYSPNFTGDTTIFGKPYEDLIEQLDLAASTGELKVRQAYYDAANELIKQHAPMVPLAHTSTGLGFRGDVLNVIIGPVNENFEEMSSPEDELIFIQESEPESLWPGDETDVDTLRVTRLLYSTLMQYEFGGTEIAPGLAEYWEYSPDLLEWTFHLRYNVKFTNGQFLDANDVVATFAAMWDAANPTHTGNTGQFQTFKQFFGNLLNARE